MADDIYRRLAMVLDTLPNGFPPTEEGMEIKLLKKVFSPEEASLFCDLRIKFENAKQIADRTGRPFEGMEEKLTDMWQKGQIFGVDFGSAKIFKMIPWVFGIYEFQMHRLDREFCELWDAYSPVFGEQFFKNQPMLMQVVPVEKEINAQHQTLPYQQVSKLVEKGQSFGVAECVCKKEQYILDKGCEKPREVCLGIAPVPGVFDNSNWGRPISKADACRILDEAEAAGLVHMTYNMQNDHFYICNCCGCCCGILKGINELGFDPALVVNSHYVAKIDPDGCVACGECADDRCQVNAVVEKDDVYSIVPEKCIGCGLCASTCSSDAISLVRKPEAQCVTPPVDQNEWFDKRAQYRGVDFCKYK